MIFNFIINVIFVKLFQTQSVVFHKQDKQFYIQCCIIIISK